MRVYKVKTIQELNDEWDYYMDKYLASVSSKSLSHKELVALNDRVQRVAHERRFFYECLNGKCNESCADQNHDLKVDTFEVK